MHAHPLLGNSSSGHFDTIDLPERTGVSVFVKMVKDRDAYFRELTALTELQGTPGVAVLLGSDESSKLIVTEKAVGTSLDQMLRYQFEALDRDAILKIFTGVASTLVKVHSSTQTVTHFDLTPSNIVVDDKHITVLVDFGLAQRGNSAETSLVQAKVGTPLYLSPERVNRDLTLSPLLSDAFALGVIGYELMSGGHPFDPTFGNVERQILFENPNPLSSKRWPHKLITAVMGLLEKDPSNRAFPKDVLAALEF